jgi:hypothetical protein
MRQAAALLRPATSCARLLLPRARSARAPLLAPPRSSRAMSSAPSAEPLSFAVAVSVDVEAVIAAARAASDVILRIYEGEREAWELQAKADNSPLTRADREANDVICGAAPRGAAAQAREGARAARCRGQPARRARARALRNPDATAAARAVSQRAWRSWRRTCPS